MIKLIVVDMDGTFLDEDKTYDQKRFNRIFDHLVNHDIQFVVASGNQYFQLKSYFPGKESDIIFVSENGALIMYEDEKMYENSFDTGLILQVIHFLQENLTGDLVICGSESAYFPWTASRDYIQQASPFYLKNTRINSLDELEGKEILKLSTNVPVDKTSDVQNIIHEKFPNQVTAVTSGHGVIDIIKPGNHKGNAIQFLLQYFKLDPKQMMIFGDGDNDNEMLALTPHSYAMENAGQKTKAVANHLAPSNEESGVLQVIESVLSI